MSAYKSYENNWNLLYYLIIFFNTLVIYGIKVGIQTI
jgi:hypothetical protein